ncbi:MAG: hypothetical protein ACRDVD_03435 [Acidimicrobiia bacterium]
MRAIETNGHPLRGPSLSTADHLESELVRLEAIKAEVAAVQARLVAEADRMQLPLSDGARSLPEWVSARIDITHEHATELVQLSRTEDLDALESGSRTVDRVLARQRLASAGATADTMAFSDQLDLAGIRRLAARHRRVDRGDEQAAFERRHRSTQRRRPSVLSGRSCVYFSGPSHPWLRPRPRRTAQCDFVLRSCQE